MKTALENANRRKALDAGIQKHEGERQHLCSLAQESIRRVEHTLERMAPFKIIQHAHVHSRSGHIDNQPIPVVSVFHRKSCTLLHPFATCLARADQHERRSRSRKPDIEHCAMATLVDTFFDRTSVWVAGSVGLFKAL